MWISIHNIDQLEEGDVIEFVSKVPDNRSIFPGTEVPFILHYGIILIQDGVKQIGHNTFDNYPQISDIERTLNGREIKRTFRTGLTSDKIIECHNKLIDNKYDFLFFNCEDYIKKITEPNGITERITGVDGIDQRMIWIIGLITLIITIVLFFKLIKALNTHS